MRKKKVIQIFSLLFFLVFLTACNILKQSGATIPAEKAKQQLSQLGFTPTKMKYIMSYPYKERPWVCYCKNSKNENWVIVLYPNGDIRKVQLGTNENISREQMINKLISLGYPHDKYMDDNLTITVNKEGKFFWVFSPYNDNGKFISFNLSGEQVESIN